MGSSERFARGRCSGGALLGSRLSINRRAGLTSRLTRGWRRGEGGTAVFARVLALAVRLPRAPTVFATRHGSYRLPTDGHMRPRSLVAPPRVTVLDALPPRVIAQRLGVPVNTARTHERLRGELDPGPGREREAMLAALVPLLGPSSALPTGSRPGSHSLPRKLSLQNA